MSSLGAFAVLMALMLAVCAVLLIVDSFSTARKWRRLVEAMGSEANAQALLVAIQAMRDEDTDTKMRKGMLALKDMGELE